MCLEMYKYIHFGRKQDSNNMETNKVEDDYLYKLILSKS